MTDDDDGISDEDVSRAPDAGARSREGLPRKLSGIAAMTKAGSPAADDEDDGWPRDPDELRRELARRLATLRGVARKCSNAGCRRARRCVGRDMRCDQFPAAPVSEEEGARRLAHVQRWLRRRLEEFDAEEEGAA